MKHIDPKRVTQAIVAIHEWWFSAASQSAKHFLPLLALLEKGAGHGTPVHFEERDDFEFWDKYFRINTEDKRPYFTPLTRRLAEAQYPHSNAATIRKNTFGLKWKAGSLSEGQNHEALWSLANDYASIFRKKGLTKKGQLAAIPVLDFAVLLFRNEEMPDDATAETLLDIFRNRFQQREADFELLFRFTDEPSENLFLPGAPEPAEYVQAIAAILLDDTEPQGLASIEQGGNAESSYLIDEEDPLYLQVRELLKLNSSGIILRGVPGTGKTWYARQIARRLVRDASDRVFEVQFHPSLGYEDFVEGYRPNEESRSGFSVVPKQFTLACDRARTLPNEYFVYIIDEINRGEPARILGDLLTFIEQDYREREFILPFSNRAFSIPRNLIVIGTMNPYDRSVTQLDSALVRRFDHIDVEPSSERVGTFLEETGVFDSTRVQRIQRWFDDLQKLLPLGIGHTYLKDVTKPEHLQLVWRYRMLPVCEATLELDRRGLENAKASFDAMYAEITQCSPDNGA